MSLVLIVTRGIDRSFKPTGLEITLSEWIDLVKGDESLRMSEEPHVGLNPRTREPFSIRAGVADALILFEGQWVPFLYFRERDGVLFQRYNRPWDDPEHAIRKKIVAVAKQLNALIALEGEDYLFDW